MYCAGGVDKICVSTMFSSITWFVYRLDFRFYWCLLIIHIPFYICQFSCIYFVVFLLEMCIINFFYKWTCQIAFVLFIVPSYIFHFLICIVVSSVIVILWYTLRFLIVHIVYSFNWTHNQFLFYFIDISPSSYLL